MTLQTASVRWLDWILARDWLVVGLLAVPMLFPRPSWTPLFLLLPLLWGLHWIRSGSPFPATPINAGLLLMAVMLLVSLWATFSIAFSLDKISGLLFSLAVFFLVARVSPKQYSASVGVFLLAGLALAGLGLISTDWPSKIPLVSRFTGQLPDWIRSLPAAPSGVHPNELGGILVLFLPLLITLAWRGKASMGQNRWAGRIALGLGACFLGAVAVLTQSRSALVGLAVGLALVLALSGYRGRIALVLLVLIGAGAIAWLGPSRIIGASGPQVDSPVGEITLASRIEIWSRAIYGLEDFSITGMGMGTFRRVVPVLYPLFTISPDKDIAHAHNIFLQTGLDLGLPGLIAYISLWLSAFGMLVSSFRRSDSAPIAFGLSARWIALGLAGGLLAHLVFSITDAVALGARPGFLWWYLLGLVAGLYRISHEAGQNSLEAER